MRRGLMACGLAVVAGSVVPASSAMAADTTTFRVDRAPAGGPALAGDSVVWASGNRRGDLRVVSRSAAGDKATLARLTAPKELTRFAGSVSASEVGFGVVSSLVRQRCHSDVCIVNELDYTLLSGPFGGAAVSSGGGSYPPPGEPCATDVTRVEDADVTGRYAAMVQSATPCAAGAFETPEIRVVTRDLIDGTETVVTTIEGQLGFLSRIEAEGDLIAWSHPVATSPAQATIEVTDRITGQTVYGVNVARAPAEFDVQADGKLAVTEPEFNGRLTTGHAFPTWYSPAEPFAHRIGKTTDASGIAIQDDRIVFVRKRKLRSERSTLVASDLAGTTTSLRSFKKGRRVVASRDIDFDGERVALAERVRRGGDRHAQVALVSLAP